MKTADHGMARTRQSSVRWLVAGLLGAALATAGARAQACSCAIYAAPLWPADLSTGVPVDTPLIAQTSSIEAPSFTLTDGTGGDVPLDTLRTVAGSGCAFTYYFLKPRANLAPGQRYQFAATIRNSSVITSLPSTIGFETGTNARVPPVASDVKLRLYAQGVDTAPVPHTVPTLQVFAESTGSEPVFLALASGSTSAPIKPSASEPANLWVGQASCAEVVLLDATGATLRSESLCTPEKCIYGVVSRDTCGYGPGWATWADVPLCGTGIDGGSTPSLDAAGSSPAPDAGIPAPAADAATPAGNSSAQGGGGCSVGSGRPGGDALAWLLLALLSSALALRLAGRRTPAGS